MPTMATDRIGRWLTGMIVVLTVIWVAYRHAALRTSANQILAEVETLQSEAAKSASRLRAYSGGFLRRQPEMFAGEFLLGIEWESDVERKELTWSSPPEGVFLVVDWSCPWSRIAVERALDSGERVVILLDVDPVNGSRWRQQFSNGRDALRVVTPSGGWWATGLPYGVTPVWFVVETEQFTHIGIGAEGVGTSVSAPEHAIPDTDEDFTIAPL